MFKEHEINKGYYIIPKANGSLINKEGCCISISTGKSHTPHLRAEHGVLRINLLNDGKYCDFILHILMAEAFIEKPEKLKNIGRLIVAARDGDKTNVSLDNLFWTSTSQEQTNKWKKIIEEKLKEHPLPEHADGRDGYFPNNVECLSKPGYYHIPLSKTPVVIDRHGNVFNLQTYRPQPTRLNTRGYPMVYLSNIGPVRYISVHRLVGMIFVPRKDKYASTDFKDLQINHKDTIKTNNDYTNLEWVTNEENMEHACSHDLFKKWCKAILSKCVATGEVRRFRSTSEACRHFFIARDSMRDHIFSPVAGRVIHNGYIFKLDDGKEWPVWVFPESDYLTIGKRCDVVIECVSTGKKIIFNNHTEVATYLGFSGSTLREHRARYGIDRPFHGWWIKTFYDYEPKESHSSAGAK